MSEGVRGEDYWRTVGEEGAESATSRHSLTKCADSGNGPQNGQTVDSGSERGLGSAIESIVKECEAEFGELANRALSVVPEHRLREEVTREVRGGSGGFKARSVKGALKAFLRWLADQEEMQLVWTDEDGNEARGPLAHSFRESYLAEKYGVIKDGERAAVRDGDELHTAMLTLTGSNLNAMGSPRCPGDHLVDLKGSWESVRRELQRVMDGLGFDRYDPDGVPARWWEYAVVVEPHKSGYAHMHVAVFASGPVEAADFRPVMEKHVEKCEMAGSDAHEIVPGDREASAVSVRRVDPSKEYDPEDGMEDITNLGSYLAAYIGASEGDMWDRPVSELICFALLWGTETRRVHFSQGFHKLADEGQEMRGADDSGPAQEWTLEGVEDGNGDRHEIHQRKVCDDCGLVEAGLVADVCPDCGGELRSRSTDYMREIRGIPGGDPPPART